MHNSGNIKKRLRNEGITKMRHQQAPTGTTIRGRHSPVLSSVGSSTVVAVVVPVVGRGEEVSFFLWRRRRRRTSAFVGFGFRSFPPKQHLLVRTLYFTGVRSTPYFNSLGVCVGCSFRLEHYCLARVCGRTRGFVVGSVLYLLSFNSKWTTMGI